MFTTFKGLSIGDVFERCDSRRNFQKAVKVSDNQCYEFFTQKIKEINPDYPIIFLVKGIDLINKI
jgi:hypothetical protein